jgi:hypothetical protein
MHIGPDETLRARLDPRILQLLDLASEVLTTEPSTPAPGEEP